MSIYITRDETEPHFLASNLGWSQVGKFIDTMDAGECPELIHLWEQGWNEDLQPLRDELSGLLQNGEMDHDVRDVINDLLDGIESADVVVVGDGMSPSKESVE